MDSLIVEAEMIDLGDEPERRRGIGRSAAKPSTGRQPLEKRETTKPKAIDVGGERTGGAQHQVIGQGSGPCRHRSGHFKIKRRVGPQGQTVAEGRERHKAFEFM